MIRSQKMMRLFLIIGAGVLVLMISMPIAAYRSYRAMVSATAAGMDVPAPSWLASMGQIIFGQFNGKQSVESKKDRRVAPSKRFEESAPVFAKNPFATVDANSGKTETLFLDNPFVGEEARYDDPHFEPNPFAFDQDMNASNLKWQGNPFLKKKPAIIWSQNPFEQPVRKQKYWTSNPFLEQGASAQ